MKQCKSFKRYQGLRAPTCNGGNPCDSCKDKYATKQQSRAGRKLAKPRKRW